MKYGDKRNYKKINIFVNGKYECSTTWAKTCKEAMQHFINKNYKNLFMSKTQNVKAFFAK